MARWAKSSPVMASRYSCRMNDGRVGAPQLAGHPLTRAGLLKQRTDLQLWHRLSEVLGCEIYAKRDDVAELGLGGNKLRKLDLILGQALADGVETIITLGGVQSNHCRQTAAVCARLGLGCTLFLAGTATEPSVGNALLDHLFGAEVHFVEADDFDEVTRVAAEHASRLRQSGAKVLVIPLGGGNGLGTYAFTLGMHELANQLSEENVEPDSIIVAAGTGSTAAGIVLGSAASMGVRVNAVSVSRPRARLECDIRSHVASAVPYINHAVDDAAVEQVLGVFDGYIGPGYTQPTPEGVTAVRMLAQAEGVLADLTYTGKALAFLVDYARSSKPERPIVFWHTGGFPELFAREAATLRC